MRQTFAATLSTLAAVDDRIFLLSGDLGYGVLDGFRERFPARFLNVGVAEQTMIGVATGLARAGFLPYVYSISPFVALRPYEFIRNGPVHHRLPVRIVGVGDGFDYHFNGPTHYGHDVIAALRVQPGLTVLAPADARQAAAVIERTSQLPGPVYYHLGTDERVSVPGLDGRFDLGRAQQVRNGEGLVLIATGPVAADVVGAAVRLEALGISPAVIIVASIQPAPVHDLMAALLRVRLAVTVESNYVTGALGSLVCEIVAERHLPCRVVRCGIEGALPREVGSRDFLRARHGLSADAIAERIAREWRRA